MIGRQPTETSLTGLRASLANRSSHAARLRRSVVLADSSSRLRSKRKRYTGTRELVCQET